MARHLLTSEEGLYSVEFCFSWCGTKLSPLGTSAPIWPIVPVQDDG
jgi:hypothetical protein